VGSKNRKGTTMSKFIIQCENINGNLVPMFDFGFEMIQAIKYQNWFRKETIHEFILVEADNGTYKDYIPIGSVEFVSKHMKRYYNVSDIKPLNIPVELYPFAKRMVSRVERSDVWKLLFKYNSLFIKEDDKIKGFADFCNCNTNLPECNYIVSELIDIKSEWRCFVRNGELLDIKCYSGEFDVLPNINEVNEMIKAYKSAPPSYTIDVAITKDDKTVIIECHNFFSCGLYGFNDYRYMPDMFVKAYHWQVSQSSQNGPESI
jgi:hypothetical protein